MIHNYDGSVPPIDERENITDWGPDYYWARPNIGQDIGAFRDLLRSNRFGDWDVLFWAVDDNIPMRKDFLRAFVEPFEQNPRLGLVGNYWVKGSFYPEYREKIVDHFRTSCFAIRREAAMQLYFPKKLENKWDCYGFEWQGQDMCMTNQIKRMGYDMLPVCGDWDKPWVDTSQYVWDIGCLHMKNSDPRFRKNHWKEWEAQFEDKK